jgi:hypothetical protein
MDNLNTDKIKKLIAKLDDGKQVSKRDLRNTIGQDGLEEYEALWEQEKERRSAFDKKPEAIKEYEAILKKADFANSKADGIKLNKRSSRDMSGRYSNERLRGQAESLYEDALIRAEEIVTADRSLMVWFDRELDFTVNGTLGADYALVPRIITSRSSTKVSSGMLAVRNKEDIKRELLDMALHRQNETEISEEDKARMNVKLKDMLAKLKGTL